MRLTLVLLVVVLLAACATCPPCPECVPREVIRTVEVPVPVPCPAVDVERPSLLLQSTPGGPPVAWDAAAAAIRHDYRELALFYATVWPQIASRATVPAGPPAPSPTPAH